MGISGWRWTPITTCAKKWPLHQWCATSVTAAMAPSGLYWRVCACVITNKIIMLNDIWGLLDMFIMDLPISYPFSVRTEIIHKIQTEFKVLSNRMFVSRCTALPSYHTCWQTTRIFIMRKQANIEKGSLVMSCVVYFWFIVFSKPKHWVCGSQAPSGGQWRGDLHLALELHWLPVHHHYSGLHWGRLVLYSDQSAK